MSSTAATVTAHISNRLAKGPAVNTLRVARSAIKDSHIAAGLDDPCSDQLVKDAIAGATRLKAGEPPNRTAR